MSLLPGADALVHQWIGDLHAYPHRCWEQILSRGVAAAIAIERGDDARFPDAKAAVQEVIENIGVFQSESGAFRYFADGEDPGQHDEAQAQHALTAYSVRALRLLGEMGHAVPGEAVGRGEGFLQRRAGRPATALHRATRPPRRRRADATRSRRAGCPLAAMADAGLPARVATTRASWPASIGGSRRVAKLRDATTRRGEARSLRGCPLRPLMSSDLPKMRIHRSAVRFPGAGDAALRRSLIGGRGDLYAVASRRSTPRPRQLPIALRALGSANRTMR